MPSKALLSAARLLRPSAGGERGCGAFGVEVNFAEVMGQVHSAIATIEPKDSAERYEGLGVKVLKGSATLVDPWTVEVNGARRTARAIILATGAEPLVPPIPGLEDCDPLTSDTLCDRSPGTMDRPWRRAHWLRAGAKPRGPGVVESP